MKTGTSERQSVESFEICKEIEISAPIDIAFAAMLDEIGPENQMLGGRPFPMKIEPWPGGRWFRDLGNNAGHLWGHVQSIKQPTLLEIYGPLFMSAPVMSHVLYRLTAEGAGTWVKFSHRAIGQIAPEHQDGGRVNQGWSSIIGRIRKVAEQKAKERK